MFFYFQIKSQYKLRQNSLLGRLNLQQLGSKTQALERNVSLVSKNKVIMSGFKIDLSWFLQRSPRNSNKTFRV